MKHIRILVYEGDADWIEKVIAQNFVKGTVKFPYASITELISVSESEIFQYIQPALEFMRKKNEH